MDIKDEDIEICGLCLKSYDTCQTVGDSSRKMMATQLNPNIAVFQGPVICDSCLENVQKYFNFKSACIHVEDYINSFAKTENVKIDLTEVYLSKNDAEIKENLTEEHTVCRLCLKLVIHDSCTSLVNETKNVISLNILLSKYLSELDLNITKDPVICTSCNALLRDYSCFMEQFLNIKQEVKSECNFGLTKKGDQNSLSCNFQYMEQNVKFENDFNLEENCAKVDLCMELKIEEDYLDITDEEEIEVKHKDIELKNVNSIEDISDTRAQPKPAPNTPPRVTYHCLTCSYESQSNHLLRRHVRVHETAKFRRMYHCNDCPYSCVGKNHINKHLRSHEGGKKVKQYRCRECSYKTNGRQWLKQHMLTHRDASQVMVYKCPDCEYEADHEQTLAEHCLAHRESYKCALCPYETKQKRDLQRHVRIHAPKPKPQKPKTAPHTFKCSVCNYETKYKGTFDRHMLVHADDSKVTWYGCEACVHKTKYKEGLKKHMRLVHGRGQIKTEVVEVKGRPEWDSDPRDSTSGSLSEPCPDNSLLTLDATYRCMTCLHETRDLHEVKRHIKIHERAFYRQVRYCNFCAYSTIEKSNIMRHLLTHKDESELTWLPCQFCDYKAKGKQWLKQHLLIHKDPSEITMHKCPRCEFQTRHKQSLVKHAVVHRSDSDVKGYICALCQFDTRHKTALLNHMRTHDNRKRDGKEAGGVQETLKRKKS